MEVFADLNPAHTKGVIIHHWDTDGLVSASILLNYFQQQMPNKKMELFVPTITNYYLTEDQSAYFQQQGYQFALTCDINFPEDTVNGLAQTFPNQVYMFDHHHQTPYTQVHYFNQPHPACASFINELLGFAPDDLLPVIAIVGDREEAIQNDPVYYPRVQAVMAKYNLTFSQLLDMRQLIDSNYIVDDYEGIQETIALLRDDPMAVLTDVRLRTNLEQIENVLTEITQQSPEKVNTQVLFFELENSYNILSHATRALSRAHPDKVIFTRQYKNNQYTCYMRRRDHTVDMRDMIAYARGLGLNAGGKEEVVGIIVPKNRMAEVFPQLRNQISQLTSQV